MLMETIEAQFTLSWASFFIDVEGKAQLVYEDFIKIFRAMYNDVATDHEAIENVIEYFAEVLKDRIALADCTLRDPEYQLKILLYLSCCSDACPTQASTVEKIKELNREKQMMMYEIIKEVEGLVSSYAAKKDASLRHLSDELEISALKTPDKKSSGESNNIMKTLEESFSNTPDVKEDWREKYHGLRRQHVAGEAEIQELNDRLEYSYTEISLLKKENENLQTQLVEQQKLKIEMDDYKGSNTELTRGLDKANDKIEKLKFNAKLVSDLEKALGEREEEITELKEGLASSQSVVEENKDIRGDLRKERHEKSRLQVQNSTLESVIANLREEIQVMLAERRQSLAPVKMVDESFEALPSLADELMTAEPAPTNEELETAKKENAVLKSKLEDSVIEQTELQTQVEAYVAELTRQSCKLEDLQGALARKTDQSDSWKQMYNKYKTDQESTHHDLVHQHRQEISQIRSDMNSSLFVLKKDIIDKETVIKKLGRNLEREKTRLCRDDFPSPTPSTPVMIRRFRSPKPPKTPSNIPRLLTPKRNLTKEVDDARIDEMSRRNQAVPPHLRSTYPVEVQYHDDEISLDSTGRVNPTLKHHLKSSQENLRTTARACTTFEIPNSPRNKTRSSSRKREALPSPAMTEIRKKENNPSVLLQFSPPKPRYKRRK